MPPQFNATSIPLFKSTGIPAMDSDCCCNEAPDCFCSEFRLTLACSCLTEPYGDIFLRNNVTFNISGTLIPFPVQCLSFIPFTPDNCVDISGSYVLPPQTHHWYIHAQYVCTRQEAFRPNRDLYYVTRLQLRHECINVQAFSNIGEFVADRSIFCFLSSQVMSAPAGASNPYPSLTGPSSTPQSLPTGVVNGWFDLGAYPGVPSIRPFSELQWSWQEPGLTYDDWLFNLDGNCTEECNTPTARRRCTSGTLTPTTLLVRDYGYHSCGMSGMTVTATVGDPVVP
jgi:hypothetical protein